MATIKYGTIVGIFYMIGGSVVSTTSSTRNPRRVR